MERSITQGPARRSLRCYNKGWTRSGLHTWDLGVDEGARSTSSLTAKARIKSRAPYRRDFAYILARPVPGKDLPY
jgi:hypothetical protein